MRPLDKYGFIPVPILFACAIPIVACIGLPGLPEGVIIALVAAAGFCLLGLQFGNIASETNGLSDLYPLLGPRLVLWRGPRRLGDRTLVGGWLIWIHAHTDAVSVLSRGDSARDRLSSMPRS